VLAKAVRPKLASRSTLRGAGRPPLPKKKSGGGLQQAWSQRFKVSQLFHEVPSIIQIELAEWNHQRPIARGQRQRSHSMESAKPNAQIRAVKLPETRYHGKMKQSRRVQLRAELLMVITRGK
jgi:hypothetical protein